MCDGRWIGESCVWAGRSSGGRFPKEGENKTAPLHRKTGPETTIALSSSGGAGVLEAVLEFNFLIFVGPRGFDSWVGRSRPGGFHLEVDDRCRVRFPWRSLVCAMAVGTAKVMSEPGDRLEGVSSGRTAPMCAGR